MRLYNLSEEQRIMMETLWSMDTEEDIERFKMALPVFRQQQINTLMELVRLQHLDDTFDQYDRGVYPELQSLFGQQ